MPDFRLAQSLALFFDSGHRNGRKGLRISAKQISGSRWRPACWQQIRWNRCFLTY